MTSKLLNGLITILTRLCVVYFCGENPLVLQVPFGLVWFGRSFYTYIHRSFDSLVLTTLRLYIYSVVFHFIFGSVRSSLVCILFLLEFLFYFWLCMCTMYFNLSVVIAATSFDLFVFGRLLLYRMATSTTTIS